jgi:anaerobic ribonucleoside-triphosphate reductase
MNNERIKKLEEELKNIRGEKCEVYSRVVGYHRPVDNWNEGKQEEFKDRALFDVSFTYSRD